MSPHTSPAEAAGQPVAMTVGDAPGSASPARRPQPPANSTARAATARVSLDASRTPASPAVSSAPVTATRYGSARPVRDGGYAGKTDRPGGPRTNRTAGARTWRPAGAYGPRPGTDGGHKGFRDSTGFGTAQDSGQHRIRDSAGVRDSTSPVRPAPPGVRRRSGSAPT